MPKTMPKTIPAPPPVDVRVVNYINIGYGENVKRWVPGDIASLPVNEATAWCLRGWAEPANGALRVAA
jgi:hypothetical protein